MFINYILFEEDGSQVMRKLMRTLATTGLALTISVGSIGLGASAVSAAAAKKPAATAPSSTATAAYDKLMAAFAKVNSYSYTAKSTITAAGQKTLMTMEGDMIVKPKQAFSMKTSVQVGTETISTEVVQVGGKTYMKLPDGSWTVAPAGTIDNAASGSEDIFNKQFKQVISKTEVKKNGKDQEITITINPAKYNKLFMAEVEGVETKKLQIKFTVDTKTSLPKKMYMITEMAMMGQTMKTEMTYNYTSYNKVKEIKAPKVSQ